MQTLHLHLKILSPLHIGCGEVYEPTSFVVQQAQNRIISFNSMDFLASLSEEKRQKFTQICKEGTVASLQKIYKFIHQHGQDMPGVPVEVGSHFVQHHQDVLTRPADRFKRELNSFLLARTAFNPVNGSVYVPGTSVKGSIRTAVLNQRNKSARVLPQQKASELESQLLGGNFAQSPFSLLKVSDFYPVSEVRRRVVYALDKKKRPTDRDASAVYQMVEVVEPGAVFAGTVSLLPPETDSPVVRPLTLEEVQSAIQSFYAGEFAREQGETSAILGKVYPKAEPNTCLLRVGRHSGAECMTIEGHRKIHIMQGRGVPAKTLDHATTVWFAAEKKDADSGLRPFGWVECTAISPEEQVQDEAFLRAREESCREERRLTRERISAQIQALQEFEQNRAEEEQKRKQQEEEDRLYPWKPWLRELAQVEDWGRLCDLVFNNGDAEAWRGEADVAQAVQEACSRVQAKFPKKWREKQEERDGRCREWLEPAGIPWPPKGDGAPQGADTPAQAGDGGTQPVPQPEASELEQRILAFKDYGQYKSQNIDLAALTLSEAQALQGRLKEWKCNDKKAKGDKKEHWQTLQARLRELKQ